MKLLLALLAVLPCLAVDGRVVNRTTGKPQPGATVTLYRVSSAGPDALESVKTAADGTFTINQTVAGGPHLVQAAYDDVTYNHMIPPGRPTTGIEIDVFQTDRKPNAARATNHMVLLEPQNGKLSVRETYFFSNSGTTTWNDSENGTLRFSLGAEPEGRIEVNATAPQGMPIRRVADKTSEAGVYKLDFPIKPGETRIDLAYTLPDASTFKSRFLVKADQTMIAAPNGVTVTGEGLVDKGKEPTTQASIFEVSGEEVDLKLEGQGELNPQGGDASGAPTIEQVNARLYERLFVVTALAFAIMGVGFALLYRKS